MNGPYDSWRQERSAITREPFAVLFIVPGLVLAAASWGRR